MLSLVRRKICPSDQMQSIMTRDTPTLSLVRKMSDASDTTQPRVSRYTQCVTLARRLTFERRRSETSDSTQSSMLIYMPIETLPWKKRRCALPIPTTIKTTTISPNPPRRSFEAQGPNLQRGGGYSVQSTDRTGLGSGSAQARPPFPRSRLDANPSHARPQLVMDHDPSDPPRMLETWECLPGVVPSSTTDTTSPSERLRAQPRRTSQLFAPSQLRPKSQRRASFEANYFKLQHEKSFLQDLDVASRDLWGDHQGGGRSRGHRKSEHSLPRPLSSVAEEEPAHIRGWWSGIWSRHSAQESGRAGKREKRESELRCCAKRNFPASGQRGPPRNPGDAARGVDGGSSRVVGGPREGGWGLAGDLGCAEPSPHASPCLQTRSEGSRTLTRAQNLPAERARRSQAKPWTLNPGPQTLNP